MTVHAEDLPAHVRKRLGLPGRSRPKPSRAGVADGDPCPGLCACGQTFPSYARWEAHATQTGHSRWSLDLPTEKP